MNVNVHVDIFGAFGYVSVSYPKRSSATKLEFNQVQIVALHPIWE
jgi:hypothetical protein